MQGEFGEIEHYLFYRGVGNFEIDVGDTSWKYDRYPTWQARAMQNSGAADLLRPYRRA